jgi:hypothetical protein
MKHAMSGSRFAVRFARQSLALLRIRGGVPMLTLALVTLAAGCGSGSGGGGGGAPGGGGGAGGGANGGGGGGGGPALEATFASIQEQIFTPICTACHIGATAPLGLRLDAANSYGLLVGVPSAQEPSLQRVQPGNPDNSYLIRKLEGTASTGGRMPLDGTPLSQANIDVVRQWITDGAQPAPSTVPPAAPIRVSSLSPLPGSLLTELPATVTAMFDREPDASSVHSETFLLERSGGDGSFGDGNDVAIVAVSIGVPAANPTSAVLDVGGASAVEDVYRVRLLGSGASMILDLDANALDGEFDGAFPSGDGTAGGDFVAEFAVSGVEASLQSIQEGVFSPICAGCHTGPSSSALPAGMDLTSAEASTESLVGIASLQVPGLHRVAPGNPDQSYLLQKLESTAAVGERMPLAQAPLNAGTLAAIRRWITELTAPPPAPPGEEPPPECEIGDEYCDD